MATRRLRIYRRDEGRCRFCGVPLTRSEFTLDHLYPRSKGGPDWDVNLVVACSPCNNQKGDMTLEESGMELLGNQAFRDTWREIQWELVHGRVGRLTVDWRILP